jgi:hypothetical protein
MPVLAVHPCGRFLRLVNILLCFKANTIAGCKIKRGMKAKCMVRFCRFEEQTVDLLANQALVQL